MHHADDDPAIAAALQRRRQQTAVRWELTDHVVLIGAGEPISIPGRADLIYRFRAHSEYFYLTDRERPGGVLAFDPSEGWVDFVRPISAAERLWEGAPAGQPPGRPVDELRAWLGRRRQRPIAVLGEPVPGVSPDAQLTDQVRRGLNHVRRPKDDVELDRMRRAEMATRRGFGAVVELIAPGRTERELQIELEAEFARGGGDGLAFDTIVGSGPNSAVLHFPPSGRRLGEGELLLIDAGAEYRGYDSDVTRTYATSGSLTGERAAVYEIVRRALDAGVQACTVGTPFRDVHLASAAVVAEGLIDLGLLRGAPEDLVTQGAVAVFFPHGVGHLVGLGARDASEPLPPRPEASHSTPGLRNALPLGAGFTTTVEPGVYFVGALVGDRENRARLGNAVNWERAESLVGSGGVRLEHNVLVTADGPEVLTADIPL